VNQKISPLGSPRVSQVQWDLVSNGYERSRTWLQEKLWGSREHRQGQSSLRRELSNLRKLTERSGKELISTNARSVWLIEGNLELDIHRPYDTGLDSSLEFLEGIDILGEDAFEDWLRETRSRLSSLSSVEPAPHVSNRSTTNQFDYHQFPLSPALAVLPLEVRIDIGGKASFVKETLAQELTACLGQLRWIPIIAPISSSAIELIGRTPEVVAQRLNARYLISGSVSSIKAGSKLSLVLSEMPGARLVQAETINLSGQPSVLELRDATYRMVSPLVRALGLTEQNRALAKPAHALDVASLAWRARYHINRLTRKDMEKARAYLDQAIAMDAQAQELVILNAYQRILAHRIGRHSSQDVMDLRNLASRAMRADPGDARGPLMVGIIETWLRNCDTAISHLQRSVELNPSFECAHAYLGVAYYLNGEPKKAIPPLLRSLELSPHDQRQFYVLGELAIAYFMSGNLELALERAEQILQFRPGYIPAHVIKVNALVSSGEIGAAIACYEQLIARKPELVDAMFDWMPFREQRWETFLRSGLIAIEEAKGRRMLRTGSAG
jgi:tetratricopeptide (TPR) repeat protein